MSLIEKLEKTCNEILELEKKLVILNNKKYEIIKELYAKNKKQILSYSPFNNKDYLITKNDIECDDLSDIDVSSENSDN